MDEALAYPKIATLESGSVKRLPVWTEGESAKKKLRIQKYADKCGRGQETYIKHGNHEKEINTL